MNKNNSGPGGTSPGTQNVRDIVGKTFRGIATFLAVGFALVALLFSSGCGGGSANVIVVSVSASPTTSPIVGQSVTLTASVTGATNTSVNWTPQFVSGKPPCQYTTTTINSSGTSTTSSLTNCPADGSFGTLTNLQTTGTATYTAPASLPDPKTYPDLKIVVTAQSVQNTNKTAQITLTIISGISVTMTPTTASVPTGEPQQFSVQLTNDVPAPKGGVTWAITQQIPSLTANPSTTSPPNPYFGLPTCSPACGNIAPDPNTPNVAVYTAPTTLPTAITPAQKNNTNPATQLTIVATSVADTSSIATGTIAIVQGGAITFNGITPTIAPQGANFWDIYLDAPNISSSSTINLKFQQGGLVTKQSSFGQVKILFPLPTTTTSGTTTTTTLGSPTGARLRLLASDLGKADSVTVSVVDPAQPCNGLPVGTACTAKGAGTFTILPVRPTSIATVPDDVVQGKLTPSTSVTVDGGFFGPSGNLAEVSFQGSAIGQNSNSSSASFLSVPITTNNLNTASPGLYQLSIQSQANPLPTPNNPSVTNIALFPNYSTTPPAVTSGTAGIPAGTNPSAVDLDPVLGVLVVAETGSNAVQFYQIGSGSLTPIDSTTGAACVAACPVAVGNLPTGLSVDRTNHTVAVVTYGSQTVNQTSTSCQVTSLTGQTVTVLNVPGNPKPITAFSVDISGALQNSVCPAPMSYAIGVDPDTHLALVAYSSISTSTAANLGFILNLNPDSAATPNNFGCMLDHAINPSSTKIGQCLRAQVTLNTGVYPQVAVTPHGHMALVTPGGSGFVRGVDVTQQSSGNVLTSLSLTAGLVTATVDTTQCPAGVPQTGTAPNLCPLMMVPGSAGTVLITGVPNGANGTIFNGAYVVSVLSNNSFSYAINSTVSDTSKGGNVYYGTPDQIFSISPSLQGIAINPITNTAAMADANATISSQIALLSALDQSVSSISFSANCTALIVPCPSSVELLPTADVAWQPYTNEIVSYNPHLNQVSISDPVSHQRYAFACASASPCQTNPIVPSQVTLAGTGTATLKTVQNGTSNPLTLFGGLAVDPVTNQAFVVKSGSGNIDIIDLGGPGSSTPIKPLHLSEVLVPSPTPGSGNIGGLPNGLVPQATLTSKNPLSGVQIFGSGLTGGLQVRLDGVDITTQGGTVDKIAPNGREVDVTIPSSFLSAPHHFSLDVLLNSVQSNSLDFIVIQSVNMAGLCKDSSNNAINTMPTSVAIADQLANGPFSPIAVVTNQGCNSISVIDINPTITNAMGQVVPNPTLGQLIGNPIPVGLAPQGIAISQLRGLAVVANSGAGTASIIDLTATPPAPKVPDVTSLGTNPMGVAINDPTGVAIIANYGSNNVTSLNFGLLFPPAGTAPPTTLTPNSIGGIQFPLAVAIDPDRGQNNQGIAVVSAVQLASGSAPTGALAVVEIGLATPILSTTISSGFVSSTPTGVVFDPAVATGTANPGVFFTNSSGTNSIEEFNPDSGSGSAINVGINPTSLAVNPQTGALITSNFASNTASVVDISSSPFKTLQTLGIPGSPIFGVAIDQFTNLAVIVDQVNQRVLLFPMPN